MDCTVGVELPECAQILIRSSFEAAGKILFITLQPKDLRSKTANELITTLNEIYNRRNKERAGSAAEFAKTKQDADSALIYGYISRSPEIRSSSLTRSQRKSVEHKWSFTTIIDWTHKRFIDLGIDFPFSSILYDYGMSSHLLHADGVGLDLELDQATRPAKEAETKILAEYCKIYTNSVSCWLLSALGVSHMMSGNLKVMKPAFEQFGHFFDLITPYAEEFSKSQQDFYATQNI